MSDPCAPFVTLLAPVVDTIAVTSDTIPPPQYTPAGVMKPRAHLQLVDALPVAVAFDGAPVISHTIQLTVHSVVRASAFGLSLQCLTAITQADFAHYVSGPIERYDVNERVFSVSYTFGLIGS